MPKLDLTSLLAAKGTWGDTLALKGAGFAWAKPASAAGTWATLFADYAQIAPIAWDFSAPAETYPFDQSGDGQPETLIQRVDNLGYAGAVYDLVKTGATQDQNAPKLTAWGAECRRTTGGVGDTMKFTSSTIPSLYGVRAYVLGRMVNGSQRSYIAGLGGSINLAATIQMALGAETLNFAALPPARYALYELAVYPPGVIGPLGTVGLRLDGGAEQQLNLGSVTMTEANTSINKLFEITTRSRVPGRRPRFSACR